MTTSRLRAALGATFGALLLTTVCAAPAFASTDAPFKGKQVTIAIGYGPGGGFDAYGRLLARYLPKHIPGNPTVIVQNVVGAGSLTLANTLYNTAPRDGTEIALVAQTLPLDQLLGSPGINFDFAKFNAIGRMASSITTIVASSDLSVKSIADAKKIEIATAATGPSSEASIFPTLLNNLIGTKFRLIRGYDGTQEMTMALERGEVGATSVIVSSLMSQFAPALKADKFTVLVQDAVARHPLLPDVPTTVELATNEEDAAILKLFAVGSDIGRAFIAPPNVPPERIRLLRDAFSATLADPELVAAADKAEMEFEPMSGDALQALIEDTAKLVSPAMIEKAIKAKQQDR